jgi:hypothetical protein
MNRLLGLILTPQLLTTQPQLLPLPGELLLDLLLSLELQLLLLLRMLTRLSRLLPLLLLLLRPLLLPRHSAVLTATRSLPPTIREATLQALFPQFLKRLAYSLHAQLRGTIPQPVLAVHCAFICDYTSLGIKDRIKVVLIEDGVSDAGFCEQEQTGERRF